MLQGRPASGRPAASRPAPGILLTWDFYRGYVEHVDPHASNLTIYDLVFNFSLRLDLAYGPGRGVYMHLFISSERSDALWR